MELSHRSDHELLSEVATLVGSHRQVTAKLWAEQAFGREHVERLKHFRQRKWMRGDKEQRSENNQAHPKDSESWIVFEKVHQALTKLGFGSAQARSAIAEVQRHHRETPPIEEVLREAVLVASANCA